MAMNDEETVALIAGGHSFGKAHGAVSPKCVGPAPAANGVEAQGLGWENKCGKGKGADTITSGLEGAWSATPTNFSTQYLDNLYAFEWVKTKSPAGATQWIPKDGQGADMVPDAHDPTKRHAPIMFTTDIALKFDPSYQKITKRFQAHPDEFIAAFSKAWFKLTHRDLGPRSRYLGIEVPKEELNWQDPIPAMSKKVISAGDIAALKSQILKSGLTGAQLIRTAWASAATFRRTDKRGGANGARIRLAPEKDWAANNPEELAKVLAKLEEIHSRFNKTQKSKATVSMADLIVLGGVAALEQATKVGGHHVKVPFTPGRMDASQDQTDVMSVAFLEPKADGFRNYYAAEGNYLNPLGSLIDRANQLDLSVPEMTVLVGGLRVLNANTPGDQRGVLTATPGHLTNDFFLNLLDMSTKWQKSETTAGIYNGVDRKTGAQKWTASSVDLIFGSQSELRAISEVYAAAGGEEKFVRDFVKAWNKVMMSDRFELKTKTL
jgi:catalase-peroxidase